MDRFFLDFVSTTMFTTIESLQKQLGYIPFPEQLSQITGISHKDAGEILKEYIHHIATHGKTKGTQLFCRFYENESELFRKFRQLNQSKDTTKNPEFHVIGEKVQAKLRNLEHILTNKMIKRDTDRTVTAFYNHARLFFPYLDSVGLRD